MSEKVGGIEYEVGMDVDAALKGGKALTSELNKLEKTSATTDKKIKALNDRLNEGKRQFTIYANETERAKKSLEELKASSDGTAKATSRIEAAQIKYEKALAKSISSGNRLTRANEAVRQGLGKSTKGMGDFGRKAGMAGVQFEQLIGSINAGQNPMRAFGFQATDLGIVLGFPLVGAIAGISASLLSVFLPALLSSGESVDKLIEKMEEWKKTIGLTREQADFLINKEKEANVERGKTIAKYKEEINQIKTAIENQKLATDSYDLSEKALKKMTKAQSDSKEELDEKMSLLQAEVRLIIESGEKMDIYNRSVQQGTEVTKKQKEEIEKVKESISAQLVALRTQVIALEDGEEAAFRYATAQSLGLKAIEKLPDEIDKAITKVFELKEAQEEAAQKEKDDSAAVQREQQVIDKLDQQIAQREMSKTEYQEFLLMQQLGIENEGQMTDAVKERLDLLRSLNAEQGTFSGEFKEQMKELKEETDNVGASLAKAFKGNITSAVDNLSGSLADAVVNQESLGDAVKETAKAFLRDMITSLIKAGIQMAINFALEKTMGAASTTASATQAGILATAWAPAATMTSLAMAGTNAPLAMAGMASTFALSEGLAVAGARFNGGSVQAGGLYKVNENNKSEGVMFGHGNEQYLMPNKNGKITSNRDMNSGGGAIQVTVNNYGEPMEVRTQQNGNVVTIDMLPNLTTSIMQNDFANRGKARKTLESTSNLTNRTS